jgi:hypothetical protein
MPLKRQVRVCALVLVAASLAAGCGGGGSAGVSPPQDNANPGDGGSRLAISGTPQPMVAVNQGYSFQPLVSGASGGSLTFSADHLPGWLALDARTGRISGTPSSGDVGSYSVTLRVSDGVSQAQLGPFTITVVAMGSGSATLSWTPPMQNSDGSTLTDLAGFVILYGQSPSQLDQTIAIRNPSVSTYVVENLTSGTWYFAVQAENSAGLRSLPSETVSKRIS